MGAQPGGEAAAEAGATAIARARIDDDLNAPPARREGGRMRPGARVPRLDPAERPHSFGGPNDETVRSLGSLQIANRYFGGARSILSPVCRLLRGRPPGTVRLLDVGCGGADVARALAGWARRRAVSLRITAVDQDPVVAAHAAAACRSWPEIRVVRADATRLPFAEQSVDIVMSSMLLHYFGLAEAAALLGHWRRLATRAVVVADVHRHWFPCVAIDVLGRISSHPLFREGHGRTVRRGFTADELRGLGRQAGFTRTRVRRHVPFRLSLVGLP
jgi:ubiquinone/menaquinone biosynthesis C-methylase UbiE